MRIPEAEPGEMGRSPTYDMNLLDALLLLYMFEFVVDAGLLPAVIK